MSKLQNIKDHIGDLKERARRMFMKAEERPIVTLRTDGRLQFNKPSASLLNISEGDSVAVYETDDGRLAVAKCKPEFRDRGYPVKGGKVGTDLYGTEIVRDLFIRSTNYFEHRTDLYGTEVVYEIYPLHYFDHGEMLYMMKQIRPKPTSKKRPKK